MKTKLQTLVAGLCLASVGAGLSQPIILDNASNSLRVLRHENGGFDELLS